ncbi:geranylgeranylglyceryl/heptaprenylglyceryl phosphate synthase [Salinimicrobium sp. GXAS 041]|uniref:geranylgeranylglyceryl/heptaprenylglyceryl phosphate synthase n=1 Tax=Salinimicrobium sp. GXAS 041 TaxID=3400806 RepID=UPI003C75E106
MSFLNTLQFAALQNEKLLAVLVDPDKFEEAKAAQFLRKLPKMTSFLLVGGSTVEKEKTHLTVMALKKESELPVILFPGDYEQISNAADGILFLSLISGRDPEYLIEQHIKAVPLLKKSKLEIIPTGYVLINGGRESAVERISRTKPIFQEEEDKIVKTALAGEYSGKQIIYLEAGSGAAFSVNSEVISAVKNAISVPLFVGGGIRNREQLEAAWNSGADVVVVGTAFEENEFSAFAGSENHTLRE